MTCFDLCCRRLRACNSCQARDLDLDLVLDLDSELDLELGPETGRHSLDTESKLLSMTLIAIGGAFINYKALLRTSKHPQPHPARPTQRNCKLLQCKWFPYCKYDVSADKAAGWQKGTASACWPSLCKQKFNAFKVKASRWSQWCKVASFVWKVFNFFFLLNFYSIRYLVFEYFCFLPRNLISTYFAIDQNQMSAILHRSVTFN